MSLVKTVTELWCSYCFDQADSAVAVVIAVAADGVIDGTIVRSRQAILWARYLDVYRDVKAKIRLGSCWRLPR